MSINLYTKMSLASKFGLFNGKFAVDEFCHLPVDETYCTGNILPANMNINLNKHSRLAMQSLYSNWCMVLILENAGEDLISASRFYKHWHVFACGSNCEILILCLCIYPSLGSFFPFNPIQTLFYCALWIPWSFIISFQWFGVENLTYMPNFIFSGEFSVVKCSKQFQCNLQL